MNVEETALDLAIIHNELNEMAQEELSRKNMVRYAVLLSAMDLTRDYAFEKFGVDEFYDELEGLQ